MKLYTMPGACSTACHIMLLEVNADFVSIIVNLRDKTLPDGASYLDVNPKGQVPALLLEDGALLTEVAVILQYLADRFERTDLLASAGTMERYKTLSAVNYIATELHKTFSPLLRPFTPEDFKEQTRNMLLPRVLASLDAQLVHQPYLAGDHFTIADIYAFVVLSWARIANLSLEPWPTLDSYIMRVGARDSIQEAYKSVVVPA
ncbi:MAG: glutathione transferase GstA [Salipiger thiooxidans]|uniref:glutathione transferase GstA n=1 Tax=Salipiger thiooxidans TaxID=282683 RepID=UPI001CFB1823|nr:glutathione transferase GstA [Salipiger thiooxidans]